jgi:hypothetical protein
MREWVRECVCLRAGGPGTTNKLGQGGRWVVGNSVVATHSCIWSTAISMACSRTAREDTAEMAPVYRSHPRSTASCSVMVLVGEMTSAGVGCTCSCGGTGGGTGA